VYKRKITRFFRSHSETSMWPRTFAKHLRQRPSKSLQGRPSIGVKFGSLAGNQQFGEREKLLWKRLKASGPCLLLKPKFGVLGARDDYRWANWTKGGRLSGDLDRRYSTQRDLSGHQYFRRYFTNDWVAVARASSITPAFAAPPSTSTNHVKSSAMGRAKKNCLGPRPKSWSRGSRMGRGHAHPGRKTAGAQSDGALGLSIIAAEWDYRFSRTLPARRES